MKKILNSCICILFTLFVLISCSFGVEESKSGEKIRIGVTASPHGEILNNVKKIFNLDFEVVNYIDYESLNNDLISGKIQGNFFQTRDYMDNFNLKSNVKLVEVTGVHVEPLVIYSSKYRSIENVDEGDSVYIPLDDVNRNRALELLQDAGLIKISRDLSEGRYDIIENYKNLIVNEVSSGSLPHFYTEADIVVMNTNTALENNILPHISGIFYEKSFLEDEGKVNILATTESMRTSIELKNIAQVLNSYETFKFINEKYRGFVKSVF